MTVPAQENQVQENKPNDKEINFRNLENRYKRELELERNARMEAERNLQESRKVVPQEDEDDGEPYVVKKQLEKKLAKYGEQSKKETQSDIQRAVEMALQNERKTNWLKNNPDFHEVLSHAEKLALKDPELAESLLEMPEGFERQKLVYKTIKSQGLHKPEVKPSSIQDKIDSNRRGAFYQPTGVGSAPYSSQGDFSQGGQKQAYEKMQELKSRLRI